MTGPHLNGLNIFLMSVYDTMFGHNMFCPDIFCLNFCSDIFCLNLCCQDIFCHDMFCSKYFLQVDEAIRHFYEVSKGEKGLQKVPVIMLKPIKLRCSFLILI